MSKQLLIVDDSALVRKQLRSLVENLDFEVDIAKNGQEAINKALAKDYDVITMDINMPVLDGISAVKEIMDKNPTAILMVSSLVHPNALLTLQAMEYGAIDFVLKPGTMNIGVAESGADIIQKVKALSRIPRRRLKTPLPIEKTTVPLEIETPYSGEVDKVVLVGVSTGGPRLVEEIVVSLPIDYPYPVCIVQHMPAQFTLAFAQRLAKVTDLPIHHTSSNDELLPGHIYIASGGTHLHLRKKISGRYVTYCSKEKNERFFMPSVDELFFSALKVFDASKILAILLTGIGDDGADGMVEIKKSGGYTIGESEESCIVYGMPQEAFKRGGTVEMLDFPDILKKIISY